MGQPRTISGTFSQLSDLLISLSIFMSLKKTSKPATNRLHSPNHANHAGASPMTPKALISALVLSVSLSVSQALALTPEELAKAQELGSQLNPPVDIAELLAEAGKYGVECDPTSKNRIRICKQEIEIEASKARTEANYAEIEASKARTQANYEEAARLKAESDRLDKENAELIRELHRIIDEKNR
jgi:hypothetical protein